MDADRNATVSAAVGRVHPKRSSTIPGLLVKLASERWVDRHVAENGLRGLGREAVPALTGALESSSVQVRWGATKVLGDIADPSSVGHLVGRLEDVDGGVRWLAAQGLIHCGPSALVPLLRILLVRAHSPWLQEGAHHVLRGLANAEVSPVIVALEGHYPALTVPVAAHNALKSLAPAG